MTEAVLFIVFNRPETTREAFASIRAAKPPRLYVAGDGPRSGRAQEADQCELARKIATDVDWPCEVRTLFRPDNLGCGAAVSSAIDWFFENEEEGIILEDDCLADSSFYGFCEQLLNQYRHDTRVSMISGTNYLFGKADSFNSYYFSRYFTVWGWASWRRAWKMYDREMRDWPELRDREVLKDFIRDKSVAASYSVMFDTAYSKQVDTWDLQWVYSCLFQSTLSIVPTRNLVSNIGIAGTHTGAEATPTHRMPTRSILVPELVHPRRMIPDMAYDAITFARAGMTTSPVMLAYSSLRSASMRFAKTLLGRNGS